MRRASCVPSCGLFLSATLIVAGCSSGGGDTSPGEVKDTTPPAVVSSTPGPTDIVPVDYTFAVTFSERLDPSTVTSAHASIAGVPTSVSSKCSSVFLKPTSDLANEASHTLTISGVTDMAGNVLATPYSRTFTTCSLAQAIAAGGSHSLVLKRDHTVWAWGSNASGQLGDGTTTDRNAPVLIPGLTHVVALAGGGDHSLALKDDGSVAAWGGNDYGQLGDGTTTRSTAPLQVSGLTNAFITAVSGGARHSIALEDDGTVWTWGDNGQGQLGDGTTTQRRTPVSVSGLAGAIITAVSAGTDHSLALKNDGTVWAWGDNSEGQLGDGTKTASATPVAVSGLTNVTAIAATNRRSYAMKADGTVWVWGYQFTQTVCAGCDPIDPTRPRQIITGVSTIAAAGKVVFLTSGGTVDTWDYGLDLFPVPDGRGDGGGVSNIVAVAAGGAFTLALRNDGTVLAWGGGGLLGDGTTAGGNAAVEVKCSSPETASPAVPTGATATEGLSRLTVSWNAVAGASSYDLLYSTASSGDATAGSRIECVTPPYVMVNLPPIAHYVCVVASNGFGTSACSHTASGTPTSPPPPPGGGGNCKAYTDLFRCHQIVNGVEYVMGLVPNTCACPSNTTLAGTDNVTPGGPWKMCTCN
jgi:alpha-tubulin suppressor-like RCC1 family protein